MYRHLISLLAFLLAILPTMTEAEDITVAEYAEVLDSAQAGNPAFQVRVGSFLMKGLGTKKDYKEAYRWFSLAAAKDFPEAYYDLGICTENGYGVPRDPARALKLYKVAAVKGFTMGIYAIGNCYETGTGVEKNSRKADEYFQLAAENGCQYGIYKMGLYHELGLAEFAPSVEEAYPYYRILDSLSIVCNNDDAVGRLASQGYAEAQYQMGMRDPFSMDAYQWFTASAEQGNVKAMFQLAQFYDYGFVAKPDPEKAFTLYQLSAAAGYSEAQFELATIYRTGRFVGTPDLKKAAEWYRAALASGIDYAQICLDEIAVSE